jgi:SAM-dependent methyltransferase
LVGSVQVSREGPHCGAASGKRLSRAVPIRQPPQGFAMGVVVSTKAGRFAFGKNWASYSAKVTEAEIVEAERRLARLVGAAGLTNQRFLDIGSGSDLHALAALRLGAREPVAVDIDPDSVRTTEDLLRRHAPRGATYRVVEADVFDLTPASFGTFDIVYSWGVLHHTGHLKRAPAVAAALVGPRGRLVFYQIPLIGTDVPGAGVRWT